ncbi:MAG: hypothetical protein BWY70_00207 [Bacteroidetes bacterium ADurb.Bin408]|nr:MAG: hypothetical protein BWY70_00207 [Bacteroidetes bacterium ADurb.Bin408]
MFLGCYQQSNRFISALPDAIDGGHPCKYPAIGSALLLHIVAVSLAYRRKAQPVVSAVGVGAVNKYRVVSNTVYKRVNHFV